MRDPSTHNPRYEGDAEEHESGRDGVHIHPNRPASTVEVGLRGAVLAATEVLPLAVGGDDGHRLELRACTAHVVAPRLAHRLTTGAPIVHRVLLHVLNVGPQLR